MNKGFTPYLVLFGILLGGVVHSKELSQQLSTDVKKTEAIRPKRGSYYETLGVPQNATSDEIKTAYRKLSKQYHPDLNPGNAEAERRFKTIAEAYSIISDPKKRATYDRVGNELNDWNWEEIIYRMDIRAKASKRLYNILNENGLHGDSDSMRRFRVKVADNAGDRFTVAYVQDVVKPVIDNVWNFSSSPEGLNLTHFDDKEAFFHEIIPLFDPENEQGSIKAIEDAQARYRSAFQFARGPENGRQGLGFKHFEPHWYAKDALIEVPNLRDMHEYNESYAHLYFGILDEPSIYDLSERHSFAKRFASREIPEVKTLNQAKSLMQKYQAINIYLEKELKERKLSLVPLVDPLLRFHLEGPQIAVEVKTLEGAKHYVELRENAFHYAIAPKSAGGLGLSQGESLEYAFDAHKLLRKEVLEKVRNFSISHSECSIRGNLHEIFSNK